MKEMFNNAVTAWERYSLQRAVFRNLTLASAFADAYWAGRRADVARISAQGGIENVVDGEIALIRAEHPAKPHFWGAIVNLHERSRQYRETHGVKPDVADMLGAMARDYKAREKIWDARAPE